MHDVEVEMETLDKHPEERGQEQEVEYRRHDSTRYLQLHNIFSATEIFHRHLKLSGVG